MISEPVWDDGHWIGFPSLAGSVEADLCVIGLGGSGVTAIQEGLELGLTVVGIDAGLVAGEAAGRNGGFLLAGMPLFYHKAKETYGAGTAKRLYDETLIELERVYGASAARNTGSLRVATSDHELEDINNEYQALITDGFDVDRYDGPEGRGIVLHSDGVCNPMDRVRAVACDLVDSGADLYENSAAVEIDSNTVRTGLGEVHAGSVVVAVDGGLELLFEELATEVKTASLQMLATRPVDPHFDRPVYTDFGHVYFQQLPDRRLALGGRRDAHLETSWSTSNDLLPEVQRDLDDLLAQLGIDASVTHRWGGNAAFTDDSRPIYREVHKGVVAIGAYCGHGNILGPVYARRAVRQLHGGEPISAPL